MAQISIFLADDHAILRDGLKNILLNNEAYTIAGESSNGDDALKQIIKIKPDLVVLDISMPEMTGLEVLRQIKKYYPQIKVIMLSRHDSYEYVRKALKFGANGYILKDSAGEDLLKCVEEVIKGHKYICPQITGKLVDNINVAPKKMIPGSSSFKIDSLTNRELQILKLIGEGKSTREIADYLILSFATIRTHRANIMKKLDIHKATELVKFALNEDLL